MSRNPSERSPNGRSRQSSEKTRQAQSPASESAARPAPSSPTSTMPRPAAAPAMTPSAAPAAAATRPSGALATALVAASSRKTGPTHDQVAERARAIWMKSGRQAGRDAENWLEAERQLRQEMSRQ